MLSKLYVIIFLLSVSCSAQLNNTNLWVMRGDDAALSFNYSPNLTGDTLIFTVKEDRIQTSTAKILKQTTISGQINVTYNNRSFIYINLESIDTDSLSLAKYYYDIQRINNGDTTTIIIGELNLQPDIGTRYDGANTSALTSSKIALWMIIDGTSQLSVASRFVSNPTVSISGDTLIIADVSGELSLSGEFDSNDKDYSIVSHTIYQLKVLFDNGFTGTKSVWFEVRLAGYFSDASDIDLINDLSNYLLETAFDDSLLAQASRLPSNTDIQDGDYLITYDTDGAILNKTAMADLPIPSDVQTALDVSNFEIQQLIARMTAAELRITNTEADIDALYVITGELEPVSPYAPYNLTGTPALTSVTLTWSDSTSSPGAYLVEYANLQTDPAVPTYIAFSDTSTDKTETVTGLTSNNPYSFRVKTIKSGLYSAVSNYFETQTLTASDLVEQGGFFIADAEENDTTDWHTATVEGSAVILAQSDSIKHGNYAWKFGGDGTNNAYGIINLPANTTELWVRAYVYFPDSMIQATTYDKGDIITVRSASTHLVKVGMTNFNVVTGWYRWDGESTIAGGGNASSLQYTQTGLGSWHLVELHWKADASTGGYQCYIDSTLRLDRFDTNTSGLEATAIWVGFNSTSSATVGSRFVYVDDVRVDTGSTRSPAYNIGDPAPADTLEGSNGWFVDANAPVGGDGTSWATAWKTFANITWASIAAGDTLFISGGTDSTVYNETLTVGKSGTAANLITITEGLSTGYNGKVVINGGGVRYGVDINGYDYIKVHNLSITSATRGVNVPSGCNVTYLSSLTITDYYDQAGIKSNGWTSDNSYAVDSLTITNCTISNTDRIAQLDNIYLLGVDNLVIDGCTLTNNNLTYSSSVDYSDNIQTQNVGNAVISNNTLINNAGYGDQGIIGNFSNNSLTSAVSNVRIYNNVIVFPNAAPTTGRCILIRYYDWYIASGLPHINIYSNTLYGALNVTGIALQLPATVKNNIVYTTDEYCIIQDNQATGDTVNNVANNLMYKSGGGTFIGGTWSSTGGVTASNPSYTTWVNTLGGSTIITSNPLFTNLAGEDFTLQAGSPAINVGATLGAPYNVDILGVSRPVGEYSIGAYQYVAP